jgi:hypothetical protein
MSKKITTVQVKYSTGSCNITSTVVLVGDGPQFVTYLLYLYVHVEQFLCKRTVQVRMKHDEDERMVYTGMCIIYILYIYTMYIPV